MTIGVLSWVCKICKVSLISNEIWIVWSELWWTSPRMMAILVQCHVCFTELHFTWNPNISIEMPYFFSVHPQVPIMQRVLKPYLKGGGAQAFKNANFQALTQDLLKATRTSESNGWCELGWRKDWWKDERAMPGGATTHIFFCEHFIPTFGEMIQFDEHMFQMGWFNHQLGFFDVSKASDQSFR